MNCLQSYLVDGDFINNDLVLFDVALLNFTGEAASVSSMTYHIRTVSVSSRVFQAIDPQVRFPLEMVHEATENDQYTVNSH